MQDKRIPDNGITSSSELSANHAPVFARLDGPSAWCSAPGDKSPYIQITWDEENLITAITTQGSFRDFSWARNFEVTYMRRKMDIVQKGNFFWKLTVVVLPEL